MEQRAYRIGLERKLVHHCAPTLAALKPASLFTCRNDAACGLASAQIAAQGPEAFEVAFAAELSACRDKLAPCGVRIEVLARRKAGILLYVYRPAMLRAHLAQRRVAAYLRSEGYDPTDLSACIVKLHRRICGTDLAAKLSGSCTFPHEIGFFLGYPYDDVVGFIKNKGENCLCVGCWKVYSKQRDAEACFCRYKTQTAAYEDLYDGGVSLECLATVDERRVGRKALAQAG